MMLGRHLLRLRKICQGVSSRYEAATRLPGWTWPQKKDSECTVIHGTYYLPRYTPQYGTARGCRGGPEQVGLVKRSTIHTTVPHQTRRSW